MKWEKGTLKNPRNTSKHVVTRRNTSCKWQFFKLPESYALTHLNLLDRGAPNHAAILLFGKNPQQIDRRVGTRAQSNAVPITYEMPREAVTEAIVNAVAHRDYSSNASVQVMLFSDRLEVWNPGQLPPGLTPALLAKAHPSIPHNPLLARPLYLAGYIERAGTGTLDMIARCRKAGLAAPKFRQEGIMFIQTLRRVDLPPSAQAIANAKPGSGAESEPGSKAGAKAESGKTQYRLISVNSPNQWPRKTQSSVRRRNVSMRL